MCIKINLPDILLPANNTEESTRTPWCLMLCSNYHDAYITTTLRDLVIPVSQQVMWRRRAPRPCVKNCVATVLGCLIIIIVLHDSPVSQQEEGAKTRCQKLCDNCLGVFDYHDSTTWLTCFAAGDVEEEGTKNMCQKLCGNCLGVYNYHSRTTWLTCFPAGDMKEGTKTMCLKLCSNCLGMYNGHSRTTWLACFPAGDVGEGGTKTMCLKLCSFFFFCVPSYVSWIHHFGWALRMWPFFNPTIEIVTFHRHGWCMLRVFLLLAFTHLGHECQDFLSLCNGMHVCTD